LPTKLVRYVARKRSCCTFVGDLSAGSLTLAAVHADVMLGVNSYGGPKGISAEPWFRV